MVIRNFLFHRVSDELDPMWPPMQVALFEKIIRRLTQKFEVVPLEQYLHDPKAFASSRKIATVLFDDGYKDNIEYAAPILTSHKCPASFYVVTDCIDRNIPTWTYIVDHCLGNTKKKSIQLDLDFVPEKFRQLKINSDATTVRELKPWMKKLSNPQRVRITEAIVKDCDDVSFPKKMMDWNDIRQLGNSGFIIGSHSHSHPMLASLQKEEEIRLELQQSFSRIEKETGKAPDSISYPIGSFDQRVIHLSKETGYKYGLAVKQQFYDTEKDGIYQIPRVELYQEPIWKTNLRISGIYGRLKKLWR